MASVGKSVRLFLADGTSGGLITAEIMNWTGHVMAAPRSDLASLLRRAEAARTGIYLLLGDDPDSPGRSKAYVGEADDVSTRLRRHHADREFWDRVVVLTSKDMNLTKAHARYLEARFIALATSANRVTLENQTAQEPIRLPEADQSDMEFFIEQAKIILPVLGVNLLRSTTPQQVPGPSGRTEDVASPQFRISMRDADARAQEVDGEFVVRAGSLGRPAWTGGSGGYEKLRQDLESDGSIVLTANGTNARFERDVVFASPSAAAAVVLGRNSNGRSEWKVDGTRTTYAQWQESLLGEQAAQ